LHIHAALLQRKRLSTKIKRPVHHHMPKNEFYITKLQDKEGFN